MLFALFVYLFIYYLLTRLPVLLARSFGPWSWVLAQFSLGNA